MKTMTAWLKWLPDEHVLAWGVVLTLGLGCLDYATGYEASFFAFYFIPVALVAWKCGGGPAALLAVLAAEMWCLVNLSLSHHYSTKFFLVWNTAVLLASLFAVAYAITKISLLLRAEQAAAEQLRQTLSEVKTLKGLLPICAHCKKVRNEKGYWQQVEIYIREHTGATFSHGICEECQRKHYPELADSARGAEKKLVQPPPPGTAGRQGLPSVPGGA
ncbi:MAG: hypothetical protein N2689_09635 [Verrucomicrobiae bacterium]|nr:hypothetical protein [Verrucomicrobiae bacterium]